MWLQHDGVSPDFNRVDEVLERTLWRKTDWKKWICGLAHSVTRLEPITFLSVCGMNSRVYHGDKQEGRHQPLEATK